MIEEIPVVRIGNQVFEKRRVILMKFRNEVSTQ